jgi:hypothetical protein
LLTRGRAHALVGGLALAARGEPRFTRDVDLAVGVTDDTDAEALVFELRQAGYRPIATVEHETAKRLATVRMGSPEGPIVDLLFASSGIEPEVIARATTLDVPDVGPVRVTRAEELLSLKILSMTKRRRQDRVDALKLLEVAKIDLSDVRQNLALITKRGFHRDQDLEAKLRSLLDELDAEDE